MTAFNDTITRDQKFISRAWKEGSRIIANANGDQLRSDTLLIQKIADPANEPELSDIPYPLRHIDHPPASVEGISLPPWGPFDNRPLRSLPYHVLLPV
jgi:hypothetical protein